MCKHPWTSAGIHSLTNLVDSFKGNITRRQEPAQSPAPAIDYSYTFDGMNRLSSGEDETHTYDELSNLVTKGTDTYTYQDPDDEGGDQMRLASFNDGTQHDYTYDENGNPVEVTNKFSALSYDNLNLLRQIVHSQTDDYWYNWAGLRVKKTEDSGGSWKTTYTLFNGVNPLMQEVYEGAARIQTTFNIIVNGQILAQYKRVYPSTDSVVYFYLDYLGSRRVVIDSSGTAIDRYRYSAWGEATQDVGSDDYRSFTGKQYDATGLIYFNARYYDPVTGRFLTEDPAMKGISWYGYCENNPLMYVDLMGMDEYAAERVSKFQAEGLQIYNEGVAKKYDAISIAEKQRIRDQALTHVPLVIRNTDNNKYKSNVVESKNILEYQDDLEARLNGSGYCCATSIMNIFDLINKVDVSFDTKVDFLTEMSKQRSNPNDPNSLLVFNKATGYVGIPSEQFYKKYGDYLGINVLGQISNDSEYALGGLYPEYPHGHFITMKRDDSGIFHKFHDPLRKPYPEQTVFHFLKGYK